jgi:hypothetical protein
MAHLGIKASTVERYWCKYRKSILDRVTHPLDVNCKKGTGRQIKNFAEALQLAIKEIPFSRRTTLRSCAEALHIPVATLHRVMKAGVFQVAGSIIKPYLTHNNKTERLS